MQCPHCYQFDLHPKATKCHHCGGGVQSPEEAKKEAEEAKKEAEEAKKEANGCMISAGGTIGFLIALGLLAASSWKATNDGDVLSATIVCLIVGGGGGGMLVFLLVSDEGS